jgi:2-polyprenyl-3-methyl-5-hydroxy-6-metoxy-1,4-benzoquinol methylase
LVLHRDLLEAQPKGKALDVACGNGRNSMFLATLGFEVDAVDISDVAINWLSRQLDDQQLRINAVWADLTTYRFPESAYDVVVNVKYLERSIARQLARSLRPGGLLLFESFTRTAASGSGTPMNPRVTLEPGELRDAFPELDVLDYREQAAVRVGGQHKRDVARLVARRPAS